MMERIKDMESLVEAERKQVFISENILEKSELQLFTSYTKCFFCNWNWRKKRHCSTKIGPKSTN